MSVEARGKGGQLRDVTTLPNCWTIAREWRGRHLFKFAVSCRGICLLLLIAVPPLATRDTNTSSDEIPNEHWLWGGRSWVHSAARWLLPLAAWDGEYFLAMAAADKAADVYPALHTHAFFPGWPAAVKMAAEYLLSAVSPRPSALLTAAVMNFVLALLVPCLLWKWGRSCLRHLRQHACPPNSHATVSDGAGSIGGVALLAAVLYAAGPQSVFQTAMYSGPLFNFLCIGGSLALEKVEADEASLLLEFVAVAAFAAAATVRSNGILTLLPLFFYHVRTCAHLRCLLTFLTSGDGAEPGVDVAWVSRRSSWSDCIGSVLRFGLKWLRALLEALVIVTPLWGLQGYAFRLQCIRHPPAADVLSIVRSLPENAVLFAGVVQRRVWGRLTSGQLSSLEAPEVPAFCMKIIPDVYGHIQAEHWGVSLFHYWRLSKADHFIISIPLYSLAVISLAAGWAVIVGCRRKEARSGILSASAGAALHPLTGYLLQMSVLVVFCLVKANVEIILRLVASSGIHFLFLAVLTLKSTADRRSSDTPVVSDEMETLYPFLVGNQLKAWIRFAMVWNGALFFLGPLFFAKALPFT